MSDTYNNGDFMEFPKMARLNREAVITEKIDGTNAQILIVPVSEYLPHDKEKLEIGRASCRERV